MTTDERLRAKGYRIKSRPSGAEPIWEIPNLITLPESAALASVDEWDRDHHTEERAAAFLRAIVCVIAMLVCIAVGAALAHAKPERKDPTPKKVELPDISMTCQYGVIIQQGRDLTIVGPSWNAVGKVRDDGSIFLLWTDSEGKQAPSVYRTSDGVPVGKWGYGPGATVEGGEMKGEWLMNDRLIRIEPKVDL